MLGKTDIEDALKRLDTLTHEEALMANAQVLKVARRIEDKVTSVDENVKVARGEAREANMIVRHVADGVTQIKGLSSLSISILRNHNWSLRESIATGPSYMALPT